MASADPKITFEQAKAAIKFPFENIGAIVRLGLFPLIFALIIILAAFAYFVSGTIDIQSPEGLAQFERSLLPAQLVMQLTLVIFGSIIAVGIHRFIILGNQPGWTFFRFRKYELSYILTNIVIMLVLVFTYLLLFLIFYYVLSIDVVPDPNAPVSASLIIVFLLLFCLYIWIYSKLILALPNAAITGRLSLATSWNALEGNVLRFLGFAVVVFVTYLLLYFVYIIVATILIRILQSVFFAILLNLGSFLIFVLLGVAFIAYLSFVYQQLVAKPAQDHWAQNGGTI